MNDKTNCPSTGYERDSCFSIDAGIATPSLVKEGGGEVACPVIHETFLGKEVEILDGKFRS